MSSLWFTADMHFGHANIALYCNRPYVKPDEVTADRKWAFPTAPNLVEERMREDLIRRWNERVKPGDTVIHVGDFCNRGNNRGVPGMRLTPEEYERRLNGKIIFIYGNHDRNNGLKYSIDSLVMGVGKRSAFVRHKPCENAEDCPSTCEFVVCGHVHGAWKTKWSGEVLNVNVGIDANGLYPVRQDEVVSIFMREVNRVKKEGVI